MSIILMVILNGFSHAYLAFGKINRTMQMIFKNEAIYWEHVLARELPPSFTVGQDLKPSSGEEKLYNKKGESFTYSLIRGCRHGEARRKSD